MSMTINRRYRDTLYAGLMDDLSALDDIERHLRKDEPSDAKRLRNRFDAELRLLDDIGWEREPDAERFELTMPARELRPIIERIYWTAVKPTLRRYRLRYGSRIRPCRRFPGIGSRIPLSAVAPLWMPNSVHQGRRGKR